MFREYTIFLDLCELEIFKVRRYASVNNRDYFHWIVSFANYTTSLYAISRVMLTQAHAEPIIDNYYCGMHA